MTPKLLIFSGSLNKEGSATSAGCCASCSATWASSPSRSNGAWRVSDRWGCCLELLAGSIGEFPTQNLKILKQSLLSSTHNYPTFEILFGLLLSLHRNGMLNHGLPSYHAALATHQTRCCLAHQPVRLGVHSRIHYQMEVVGNLPWLTLNQP